ncbi:Tll0287-like domain-containing protein [Oceanobacter mangrovi]|uniref:Tll0287-like domain-containing protein n=1 Tax=Oceanobacter mangrovi TaxID=2862510 RepID=UPI001C8DC3F4|nr:DUF3365 domain-containing protein [Oceanobacter mangrovi]
MNKLLLSLALGLAATTATAAEPDTAALTMEARQQVKAFGGELLQTVQQGMKAGGPMAAIPLCNTEAPQIKARHSAGDWQVGRTSLKLRNPNNAPDSWELATLKSFDQRLAAGEDPMKIDASTLENGQFRYMKAIPAGAVCMNCHGQNLQADVSKKLSELYPADQAVGYLPGQLRGAFTLRKAVATQ